MKEMNRREFLTLTGAAVVALSLAGCGTPLRTSRSTHRQGSQSAGSTQPLPQRKEVGYVPDG